MKTVKDNDVNSFGSVHRHSGFYEGFAITVDELEGALEEAWG